MLARLPFAVCILLLLLSPLGLAQDEEESGNGSESGSGEGSGSGSGSGEESGEEPEVTEAPQPVATAAPATTATTIATTASTTTVAPTTTPMSTTSTEASEGITGIACCTAAQLAEIVLLIIELLTLEGLISTTPSPGSGGSTTGQYAGVPKVPNGPLDKDGLDEALSDGGISQAGNNSPQLPPVVIVPGVQNSRTEDGEKSKLRANLWIPVQLNNMVHDARVWSSMGRAGLWKDKMDPSPYSRAGLMGNHTKSGGVAGPRVGVKRKPGGRVVFTVKGRKITLTTPEMVRMLADHNARTVNMHSRLYRCKVMKRCSSRKRSKKKRSKAKKMTKDKSKKARRKNKKLWKVRRNFLHREKVRQERERKKEKRESKKMKNLRRDTKPDFFHIVESSQKKGETSSTGKLFRGTELTVHRRGF